MKKDVLIIGGGAAGLLCAIQAGRRGRSVLVLERSAKLGNKIAVSGGGRCNFTHLHAVPENYISSNPHFCRSALAHYTPNDFLSLVEKHGIQYHEKTPGQLFCDGSSKEIIRMLLRECELAGVEILLSCEVEKIHKGDHYFIQTNFGKFTTESLVIATGGLSFPKLGATDWGYRIAQQFGLRIIEPRPGLVPLTFTVEDHNHFSDLSGVSFPAVVRCGAAEFYDSVLFTHRGLSGPAILQISLYWQPGLSLFINLLPQHDTQKLLADSTKNKMQLGNILSFYLPHRLATRWSELYFHNKPMNQYSPKEIIELARQISNWEIRPSGSEGFAKAEVTAGGVDTRELYPQTMEVKKVPGLYFIGEVVDVTGWLGGYNFQWAWASGFAAGQAV